MAYQGGCLAGCRGQGGDSGVIVPQAVGHFGRTLKESMSPEGDSHLRGNQLVEIETFPTAPCRCRKTLAQCGQAGGRVSG